MSTVMVRTRANAENVIEVDIGPELDEKALRQQCGARIALLRGYMDLSQDKLGELMGLSDATISMWEKGKTEPSLIKCRRLARILRTTPEFIAFGIQPK